MPKTEPALKPDERALVKQVTELPDDLLEVIEAAGLEPARVDVPGLRFAVPVSKADLCVIPAEKFSGVISEPMVVAKLQEFPEADRFPGYKGYLRAECYLRDGEYVAWTTHLFNKQTGELGPIAEYLRAVQVPAAIRIGMFESKSHPNQFVFRPVPIAVG